MAPPILCPRAQCVHVMLYSAAAVSADLQPTSLHADLLCICVPISDWLKGLMKWRHICVELIYNCNV